MDARSTKIPVDFAIFSPPRLTMPLCSQYLAKVLTGSPLTLGDLILVMREDQVGAASVDVEVLTQVLGCHGRALDVPTRAARAPRRVPPRLARLRRLPEGEVQRVVLRLPHLDPNAGTKLVGIPARQLPVSLIGPDGKVDVPLR